MLRLLEGLGLFVCVISICRADRTLVPRLTRALVAGAVGAALLSVTYVAMDVLDSEDWMAQLSVTLQDRWTAFIGDVNTAGSYFVLTAAIALGAALAWTRWSVVWLAASAASFIALWLTRSRAAILPALIVMGAAAVWFAAARFRSMTALRIGMLALVVMVTLAVLVFGSSDLFLSPAAIQALNIRLLFLETTIDMVAESSLFLVETLHGS